MSIVNRLSSSFPRSLSKIEGICIVSGLALAILGGLTLARQVRLPVNGWALAAPGSALVLLGVALNRLRLTLRVEARELERLIELNSTPDVSQTDLRELIVFLRLYSRSARRAIREGRLLQLTALDLSNQRLKFIPESISNLTQLEALDLSENQLTDLPESIRNLTLLRVLNLNNNRLAALPESISNLTPLTMLSLGNNRLTAIPESIGEY